MNVLFDTQVSEPSCIIDLRRVPHGVGRAGLQALIFPVSIAFGNELCQLEKQGFEPLLTCTRLYSRQNEKYESSSPIQAIFARYSLSSYF